MKGFIFLIFCIALFATSSWATTVKNCPKSKARRLEESDITISSCPKNKCNLKHNTEAKIEIKIKPERDYKVLKSSIQGIILGIPLPFPGYDGTSACPYIYDAEGEKQVGCPLKAGETYVYKNSFKILRVYPTVSLVIHWGLGDKQGDVVCFEIPGVIKS